MTLPLDQTTISDEDRADYDEDPNPEKEDLVPTAVSASRAALISLPNSLASLSCDERGSDYLERCLTFACSLPTLATPTDTAYKNAIASAEIALQALQEYTVFLAINRYGSHVLQSLIATLPPLISYQVANPVKNNESATLAEPFLAIIEALSPYYTELTSHISATHVLRSSVCVLAGILPIVERKSKASKHKHSGSSSSNATMGDSVTFFPTAPSYLTPYNFPAALASISDRLILEAASASPGTIQRLTCLATSGPLLTLLFKSLCLTPLDPKVSPFRPEKSAAFNLLGSRLGIQPADKTVRFPSPAVQANESG